MKEQRKHIEDFDLQTIQSWVNNYEPSRNFVDNVMNRVAVINESKHVAKYVKVLFQLAAASAIIIFITNLFILISSTQQPNTLESDWTTVYELNSSANWYEYYNDETFIANNQTFK
jgi:hypothetical protein